MVEGDVAGLIRGCRAMADGGRGWRDCLPQNKVINTRDSGKKLPPVRRRSASPVQGSRGADQPGDDGAYGQPACTKPTRNRGGGRGMLGGEGGDGGQDGADAQPREEAKDQEAGAWVPVRATPAMPAEQRKRAASNIFTTVPVAEWCQMEGAQADARQAGAEDGAHLCFAQAQFADDFGGGVGKQEDIDPVVEVEQEAKTCDQGRAAMREPGRWGGGMVQDSKNGLARLHKVQAAGHRGRRRK